MQLSLFDEQPTVNQAPERQWPKPEAEIPKSTHYVHVSNLQKAIRFGFDDLAARSARIVYHSDRAAARRRLATILLEDIGPGDIDAVITLGTRLAEGRLTLTDVSDIAEKMARCIKSRDIDDGLVFAGRIKDGKTPRERADMLVIGKYLDNIGAWSGLQRGSIKSAAIATMFDRGFSSIPKDLADALQRLRPVTEHAAFAFGYFGALYDSGRQNPVSFVTDGIKRNEIAHSVLAEAIDGHVLHGKHAIRGAIKGLRVDPDDERAFHLAHCYDFFQWGARLNHRAVFDPDLRAMCVPEMFGGTPVWADEFDRRMKIRREATILGLSRDLRQCESL